MTKAQIRAGQIRTIVAFAEEKLGLKVTLCTYRRKIMNLEEGLGDVGYSPGHIYFHKSAFVGWLMHEVAHWLVATPWERTLPNYGFDGRHFSTPMRAASREMQAADATCGLWRLVFPGEETVLVKLYKDLSVSMIGPELVVVEKLVKKAERRHEKEKKAELLRKAQSSLSVPLGETSNT